MANLAYTVTKYLLTLMAVMPGTLLLLEVITSGMYGMKLIQPPGAPDHWLPAVQKFNGYFGSSNMTLTVDKFKIFIGCCKLAAGFAFLTGISEQLATLCLCFNYVAVAGFHGISNDDPIMPAALGVLCIIKFLSYPGKDRVKGKVL